MARWAERALVAAALEGRAPDVEALIAAVWPGCYRLAATVTGDRGLAQDAAQEACAILLRKVHRLRRVEAFDAWLYRIVMREASRVRRRHKASQRALDDGPAWSEDTASIDVWRALAALSPEQREVTVLFYFDDLQTDQIASILGVAHATVRTRLLRARDRLRGVLGDYDETSMRPLLEAKQHVV